MSHGTPDIQVTFTRSGTMSNYCFSVNGNHIKDENEATVSPIQFSKVCEQSDIVSAQIAK